MDTSFAALMGLVRETVSDPRAGARRMIMARPPMAARWLALALVAVLSVLLSQLTQWVTPGAPGLLGGPVPWLVLQVVVLLIMVMATYHVGRWMGGQGNFPDALLLVAFVQVILLLVQVAQVAAMLILPPLAGLLTFVGFGLFLWVLTGFVAELHGFRSTLSVLGMIVATGFGVAFLMALVLTMFGVTPPPPQM